jgi:hypothetical protein
LLPFSFDDVASVVVVILVILVVIAVVSIAKSHGLLGPPPRAKVNRRSSVPRIIEPLPPSLT